MPVTAHRQLPAEIRAIQDRMEEVARSYGLDFFETIFEMLDYEELSMFAAYGGFPVRYPHWRFGAEYTELMRSYSYGLSKIYEMVINTDPCYAYLLSANSITDQKLVIAHVYGHCDFFKNNAWFAPTNRKMLDQMANHAARVNRYIDRFGYEKVEEFIDACLSLEDLIDPHAPHIRRRPDPRRQREAAERRRRERDEGVHPDEPERDGRFSAKEYMDPYINPPDLLRTQEDERRRHADEQEARRGFPSSRSVTCSSFCLNAPR
ncbi:MAG: SpoVR family protein [Planctomycetaceae bacterium]